jgi:hypothetical protein
LKVFEFFFEEFRKYLVLRKLSLDSTIDLEPQFPEKYGILDREHFIKDVSYRGWGGIIFIIYGYFNLYFLFKIRFKRL